MLLWAESGDLMADAYTTGLLLHLGAIVIELCAEPLHVVSLATRWGLRCICCR